MCEDEHISVLSLENEYGCVNTKYQMNIDLNENFTIIKSQTEYDLLVTGSCDVQIDFTKYDLIIGKKGLTNGNTRIEYTLLKRCDYKKLELEITFFQNITAVAPNLTYHALIEKLDPDEDVEIVIMETFE